VNTWRLFVLLVTALLSISAPAAARETAPRAIIVLSSYLDTLSSLELSVNGIENTFLFDAAGGSTVVTPEFAKSIGCSPWDRVTGFRMRGDRVDAQRCDHVQVDIDHLHVNIPMVTVFDFSKLLPKGAPPLSGSLALDAFAGEIVTLDLAGGRLIVETPASAKARVRGAQEVPVRFAREASGFSLSPLVAVETPAGQLWMELDCGSDAAIMVARHAAAYVGANPDVEKQHIAMTLVGGVPVEGQGRVSDFIVDGNIGAPILRKWIVTIDLTNQRLWIAQRKSPAM